MAELERRVSTEKERLNALFGKKDGTRKMSEEKMDYLNKRIEQTREDFNGRSDWLSERILELHRKIDALLLVFDADFRESIQATATKVVQVTPQQPGKPSLLEIVLEEFPVVLLITRKERSS